MSIYASIPGIGDTLFGDDEDIGRLWTYQGSHVLPGEDDPRGGEVGLALIPSHITRDGRDDQPEDGAPWPWLRLGVYHETGPETGQCAEVVVNPAQARNLAEQLTAWADQAEGSPPCTP